MSSKIPYIHRTWPERPFSLIATTSYLRHYSSLPSGQDAVRVARLMALTHNTVFRAFNAVYAQAGAVDPSNKEDVTDFATFATLAIDFLENHHQCEELVFFPMLEAQTGRPGLMDSNVEQHRAFDVPLQALRRYLDEIRTGRASLDAAILQARIDVLASPLQRHLNDEIPSILEAGASLSDKAISACYKALHDEAEGTTDPFRIGPLVMGCQDSTLLLDGQRIQFPELPFSLAPHVVEHFVSRRHAGAWRFCPSTFQGEPRETEFFTFDGKPPVKGFKNGVSFLGRSAVSWLLWVLLVILLVLAVFFRGAGKLNLYLNWKVSDWEPKIGNYSWVSKGDF